MLSLRSVSPPLFLPAAAAQKQRPADYRRDIAQLADERSQLVDKLAALRKRTSDMVRGWDGGCTAATTGKR